MTLHFCIKSTIKIVVVAVGSIIAIMMMMLMVIIIIIITIFVWHKFNVNFTIRVLNTLK